MGCVLLGAFALLTPRIVNAAFPLPPFTFYGEVRNAYGWSYTAADNVQVIVQVNGKECGRAQVDDRLGPGINYRVEIPLDDGMGERYAPYAARVKEHPVFSMQVGEQTTVVLRESESPAVGNPGAQARLNFFRDTDTDKDGLPDTWENALLAASGGRLTNITQVLPGDDFDHDGMSNMAEFTAGTDPTWDIDVLEVDQLVYLPGLNRFGVGFYSVRSKTYELLGSETLTHWDNLQFSLSHTNEVYQTFWRGDGYYSWVFIDSQANPQKVFRLKTQ